MPATRVAVELERLVRLRLKANTRDETRTRKAKGRGILSPLRLPIPPPGPGVNLRDSTSSDESLSLLARVLRRISIGRRVDPLPRNRVRRSLHLKTRSIVACNCGTSWKTLTRGGRPTAAAARQLISKGTLDAVARLVAARQSRVHADAPVFSSAFSSSRSSCFALIMHH